MSDIKYYWTIHLFLLTNVAEYRSWNEYPVKPMLNVGYVVSDMENHIVQALVY